MFAAALCLLMLLIAALAGLSFGSSSVSLGAFIRALIAGDTKSTAYRIMMHSRLPRVLGAMLCGKPVAEACGIAVDFTHEAMEHTLENGLPLRYGVAFEQAIPSLVRRLEL